MELELNGKYGNATVFTDVIEEEAISSIINLLNQDFTKNKQFRIMPDVHAGAGCVIGFTANFGDIIIPNIVGVDIGCGMLVVKLPLQNVDLAALDNYIKQNVPHGMEVNHTMKKDFNLDDIVIKKELRNIERIKLSLGSLGGGNHFIEIDKSEDGSLYLVIHTGSRNLGKQIAEIYQEKAVKYHSQTVFENDIQEIIDNLKSQGKQNEIAMAIHKYKQGRKMSVPKDLAYLIGQEKENYLHDMRIAQNFAWQNRETIAQTILDFFDLRLKDLESFQSVHNYIDDSEMTRKGAISAHLGEKLIIPINMRDGCIIGIGKGNSNWNYSAPHGAGRLMSRSKAKKTLDINEFTNSMKDVYTTTANITTLDESPMVYKNIADIVDNIQDTVEIIEIIKPIYNFKASE